MKFTTEMFYKGCNCVKCQCPCKTVCSDESAAEILALSALVDSFAEEMKRELFKQHARGKRGWDTDAYSEVEFKERATSSLYNEPAPTTDYIKVANYLALAWNKRV